MTSNSISRNALGVKSKFGRDIARDSPLIPIMVGVGCAFTLLTISILAFYIYHRRRRERSDMCQGSNPDRGSHAEAGAIVHSYHDGSSKVSVLPPLPPSSRYMRTKEQILSETPRWSYVSPPGGFEDPPEPDSDASSICSVESGYTENIEIFTATSVPMTQARHSNAISLLPHHEAPASPNRAVLTVQKVDCGSPHSTPERTIEWPLPNSGIMLREAERDSSGSREVDVRVPALSGIIWG
ncbi:hypothetical protein F5Y15DRAFT_67461 [Xylariaceae sp. FL0016]|nr:hypothetical protein F5Y15DRAFT_67461 [Xylariaceae sp. FL0016]